jgi:hypothetical protein
MSEEDRTRVEEWCDWAENFTSRSDPSRQPQLIVGLHHDQDQLFYPRR